MRIVLVNSAFHRTVGAAAAALCIALTSIAAQSTELSSAMHWREIGPTRAGRARAAAGVPSQHNVFYAGYDNGGVWRSTDYGSNWEPVFDSAGTGSIGAIAVAPSDPKVIYVGTGAGIIRPDLATGDGVYKSTDGGKTWANIGLHDTQMIAYIDVDPTNPDRVFVAALGHPYGPNAERGIFRSTDGGKSWQKVLYKDEYASGNDVRIDPSNPNIVYAALWEQQQSFIEGGGFGSAARGIYKSVDGGTTWTEINDGLPPVLEANIAIAPSNPRTLYAMVAAAPAPVPPPTANDEVAPGGRGGGRGGRGGGRGGAGAGGGGVGFYKSTDGGEHWHLAVNDHPGAVSDNRPLVRIGGGDLPTIVVDPKNENVIYSSSTVLWRTEDGGATWSAVRGAPGGDDYQRTWINPNDPNIILQVADQGAVVSANRGLSWSNWYNQPTAAMYHVSTDNSFPFRVCGGQQDSGSACVESQSMDGEITFHDWHPVNIQEYGVAAPDPKNPDLVYGSQRTNVSLYNRKTGQTSTVGPSAEQRGTQYGRNVRTMPIEWSRVDPHVLYYTSNVVWKSTDEAHSWTRISPDLARQTWAVPANAGKYASTVTPGPQGSITALSASPRSLSVIWAGTDDGNIQVTMDGGAHWSNVTPAAIKPWTRIFNIDAGHFDNGTAYAAANTMRLDDMNPHFWRTHDGGKSWTEIDNGLPSGAVANSIREDPRVKGLLYAATELQTWVSYDDGDHWSSLALDMPPISVRDIQVKDDSTCRCADLVAGTHGRGFWILDDLTPLRQHAQLVAAANAHAAYLFKPQTALRVRFATNDPTPWPPELPAGENPPPGALIDYYLPSSSNGPVKLEILDAAGKTIRTYTSDNQVVRGADPATDPAKYNTLCQQTPTLPDCGLPLYWPAPALLLSNQAGMHRFNWDLRFDPIGEGGGRGGGGSNGAVPHRTYAAVNAPWAPPGNYTVRLTADGKSYTQPLLLELDPRVKTPAAGLAQLASLTRELYDAAAADHAAFEQARALAGQLQSATDADAVAFRARLDSLAPPPAAGGRGGRGGRGGFVGRGGGAPQTVTLESASTAAMTAAMAMQNADVTPTASEVTAASQARSQSTAVMAKWNALRTTGLSALNAKRRAAGLAPITVPRA
ncbi:MAG TPA: hypothetical protein VN651_20400 [Gemmatimonadaceae bacterium]|nr:hypothetical protein [Gemmatimonadaceae bacterium]